MGKIIAVSNHKGGVGKTTTAVNLAHGLILVGKKVLLIDTDPQYNASHCLGYDPKNNQKSIYDVFTGDATLNEIIIKNVRNNLDLCPSTVVGMTETLLSDRLLPKNPFMLKNEIDKIKDDYDFIIIDTPPSIGMINKNCYAAANSLLIPIQVEYFALQGVVQILKTIRKVKTSYNSKLTIEGILITMMDVRNNISHKVQEDIIKTFAGSVYDTVIPRNIKIVEATMNQESIFEYDPKGIGSIAYFNLVKEVLKKNGQ